MSTELRKYSWHIQCFWGSAVTEPAGLYGIANLFLIVRYRYLTKSTCICKIKHVQELRHTDHAKRMTFALNCSARTDVYDAWLFEIAWEDEAYIYLNVCVNTQNFRISDSNSPIPLRQFPSESTETFFVGWFNIRNAHRSKLHT